MDAEDLNLFRVTLSEEWVAEEEVLVWAPDEDTAEKWAEEQVEPDFYDATSLGIVARSRPEPLDEYLPFRIKNPYVRLVMPAPGSTGVPVKVHPEVFLTLLTPKRMDRIRLARIESGNGQLGIPGLQPVLGEPQKDR